jgi:hypothetical protein
VAAGGSQWFNCASRVARRCGLWHPAAWRSMPMLVICRSSGDASYPPRGRSASGSSHGPLCRVVCTSSLFLPGCPLLAARKRARRMPADARNSLPTAVPRSVVAHLVPLLVICRSAEVRCGILKPAAVYAWHRHGARLRPGFNLVQLTCPCAASRMKVLQVPVGPPTRPSPDMVARAQEQLAPTDRPRSPPPPLAPLLPAQPPLLLLGRVTR